MEAALSGGVNFPRSREGSIAPNPIRMSADVSKSRQISTKRSRNRTAPHLKSRSYDLGSLDSSIGWDPIDTSADGTVFNNLGRVRARTRDLARNDDYCRQFLRILVSNVIGPKGIKFQSRLKFQGGKSKGRLDKIANAAIEKAYKVAGKLKNHPTVNGKSSLRKVQGKWLRDLFVDGEVIVMLHYGTTKNKTGFAIEFIDPARLDATMNETRNGNRIKMGVELDDQDEPVAYWILEDHPQEMLFVGSASSHKRKRIPAKFIRHTFFEEQTGQTRGISMLASAALRTHLIDQFEKATVVGGVVAARKVGFYKVNQEAAEDYGVLGGTVDEEGYENEDVNDDAVLMQNPEAGQLEVLPSYVDGLETFDPSYPPANFEEFEKRMIRGMAAGFGVQYHSVANDLESVNFSSARAGEQQQRPIWQEYQELIIEEFLEFHVEGWGEMTLLRNDVDLDRAKLRKLLDIDAYEFVPKGWDWVDPMKEMQANEKRIEMGLTTRSCIISESSGKDFEDVIDDLSEEEEYMISKGLNPRPNEKNPPTEEPPKPPEE